MDITITILLLLLLLAAFCEYIDAALGMGYGTILTPILIILNFDPHQVVPSILISQAVAGLAASYFHQRCHNVNYSLKSVDLKVVALIVAAGLLATIFAALISVNADKFILGLYIGILIVLIGLILVTRLQFTFSWRKIFILGIISAFNKGLSGGGFGPIVTGGQIVSGQNERAAIGVTTLAEVAICLAAFVIYFISGDFQWRLAIPLTLGAVSMTPLAAKTTARINPKRMRLLLGILITILGGVSITKTIWAQ